VFSRARSAWIFDRCLATLVHKLKYNGRIGLARPLGIFMLSALLDNWNLDEIDCVVPVPLHRKRMSLRGFNQSYMLSKFWPAMEGPGIAVDPTVLIRVRQTASQTGLGRRERAANLKNAFRINPGKRVADLRLLLVDDVFTTGATVNECSKILLKGGASRVDVLTLARTG
jgi:ComF family protein